MTAQAYNNSCHRISVLFQVSGEGGKDNTIRNVLREVYCHSIRNTSLEKLTEYKLATTYVSENNGMPK